MIWTVVLLAIAMLVPLALFLAIVPWLRKLRNETAEEVRQWLGADKIVLMDPTANSFGVESKGVMQVRGNGCLAATEAEIMFRMWRPRKELTIPREQITRVETVRSHLGKSKGGRLLKVRFVNGSGNADSVAWIVRDLNTWLDELAQDTHVERPPVKA